MATFDCGIKIQELHLQKPVLTHFGDPYPKLTVNFIITYGLELPMIVVDQFMEGFEFMELPARIVVEFIKNNHGATPTAGIVAAYPRG
jgi:hypothetical protein